MNPSTRISAILLSLMCLTYSIAQAKPQPYGVVLPLNQAGQMEHGSSTGIWKPSAAEVAALEKDLSPVMKNYFRQYMGITDEGRRLILINGFSYEIIKDSIGTKYDWSTHAHPIYDGGTLIFWATYDVKTRKFDGPHYHGVGFLHRAVAIKA